MLLASGLFGKLTFWKLAISPSILQASLKVVNQLVFDIPVKHHSLSRLAVTYAQVLIRLAED
jgi:hypothetical protein